MDRVLNYLVDFFELGIFFYCTMILLSYITISFCSYFMVRRFKKRTVNEDYRFLLNSPLTPSIAVIAPAYNEAVTIVDNIRSLLSLHYPNLTVIIVNDGSQDDTLSKAIEAYNLVPVIWARDEIIPTQKVKKVYRSLNPAFKKLIVVDKENGGKADAINVGINISRSTYFACIDVDCIIEQDAFLRLAKPIMQRSEIRTVAVGGMVGLTNESEIDQGRLLQLKMPKKFVIRMQVLEYFRAFIMGRTTWSTFNGMLLISGAFGIFERKCVLECGGYNHNTVGEDMELVMRMHRYMRRQDEEYQVAYVPQPLCWTEAPSSYKILGRQRNRWTRGTMECLWEHRKMLFNFKDGVLGFLSYPYWLMAEWLAPYIEFLGLIYFALMAWLDLANLPFFYHMVLLVYTLAIFISGFAIYTQEKWYGNYNQPSEVKQIFKAAILEPFLYHPRTVWWAMKGNYDLLVKKSKGWGKMTRTGF